MESNTLFKNIVKVTEDSHHTAMRKTQCELHPKFRLDWVKVELGVRFSRSNIALREEDII